MNKEEKFGYLNIDTSLYQTKISDKFATRIPYQKANPMLILSFIPGTVLDIFITEGQSVKEGEELMILDAMKMKNKLKAPFDGRVKEISVKKGDKVSKGTLLVELE